MSFLIVIGLISILSIVWPLALLPGKMVKLTCRRQPTQLSRGDKAGISTVKNNPLTFLLIDSMDRLLLKCKLNCDATLTEFFSLMVVTFELIEVGQSTDFAVNCIDIFFGSFIGSSFATLPVCSPQKW